MPADETPLRGLVVPGLPLKLIRRAYEAAPGNEIGSGKFANPESSAALAANAFGFFLDKAQSLPALPRVGACSWPATNLFLEASVRFPWRGGHHPCLDALVHTPSHLIGIESKRYEPFRSRKDPSPWSDAYDRDVWGDNMGRYGRVRDFLKNGDLRFTRLDAVQLVKHAFGLRSAVHHDPDYAGKSPVLLYVFAEPNLWPDGRAIVRSHILDHRQEVLRFAELVAGDEVAFSSCSYRELLDAWSATQQAVVQSHAESLLAHFDL
jgi:hypothetical protein